MLHAYAHKAYFYWVVEYVAIFVTHFFLNIFLKRILVLKYKYKPTHLSMVILEVRKIPLHVFLWRQHLCLSKYLKWNVMIIIFFIFEERNWQWIFYFFSHIYRGTLSNCLQLCYIWKLFWKSTFILYKEK